MFIQRKIAIGTFNNILNIHGAGLKPKQRERNSYKLPDQLKRTNWLEFFSRELKNTRLLSIACTCNILFATYFSDFTNLPLWRGNMQYRRSVWPPFFLSTKNKLLTNSPFDAWTSLMTHFFYLPFHQFFPFST